MDISDDSQSQQQTAQQDAQQQQQMQCDPIYTTAPLQLPIQTAIPLPAPPSMSDGAIPKALAAQTALQQVDVDIDSVLLQQFSCMGTTDHEDLISQFQSLMNDQLNKDSARFFLEMNNWNLQTAVGCYLDYCNLAPIPSMKIVDQAYNGQTQTWRLENNGTENWPSGCYLISPSQEQRILFPFIIKPGDSVDICANIPPVQPAIMWRLCTPNGWYFGETIWMIPPGTCNTQADLVERMSQLKTSAANSMGLESFPQVEVRFSINLK